MNDSFLFTVLLYKQSELSALLKAVARPKIHPSRCRIESTPSSSVITKSANIKGDTNHSCPAVATTCNSIGTRFSLSDLGPNGATLVDEDSLPQVVLTTTIPPSVEDNAPLTAEAMLNSMQRGLSSIDSGKRVDLHCDLITPLLLEQIFIFRY
ncbi:unnamed protein product [Protopolystoma xenopodis]|uniref:Uncharacterized protein n=1 Tax=Protopolystoma xenopodis TaxID=117903 RepID=A0A3S5A6T1_9PLAT|nr:unnamed protein product [Protopolystoma xenopodis]